MTKKGDRILIKALTEAYTARAILFHNGVLASGIDLLIAEIDSIDSSSLEWDKETLGISESASHRVRSIGSSPHQVFAHPQVIADRPHLIAYYRNMATISKKGIGQILFSTNRFESRSAKQIPAEEAWDLCKVFNKIISGVIDSVEEYQVTQSRQAILAEIGAELQGKWANFVGQGAAKNVEELLAEYIEKHGLGNRAEGGEYTLQNGWRIIFGTEPDVSFVDSEGRTAIAIEIKGSLDKAGAQTRYGEGKKSFAKVLSDNPRCHTIYLASCFTEAVIEQIKADAEVRDRFNLTSILYDAKERDFFLRKLFHIVQTPSR